MILDDYLQINGVLAMTGGAGSWIQYHPKTTAQAAALVATWGINESARIWFNTDTSQLEMWNGVAVVILG